MKDSLQECWPPLMGAALPADAAAPVDTFAAAAPRRVVIQLCAAVILLALCAAAVLSLNRSAAAGRTYAGPASALADGKAKVTVVGKTTDLYRLWREKKLQGRVVVNLGNFLHCVPSELEVGYHVKRGPVPLILTNQSDFPAGFIDHRNFLWGAVKSDVARRLYHVMPPETFRTKLAAVPKDPETGDVLEHEREAARIISTRLPALAEPVVLNIDASFIGSYGAEKTAALLRASSLSSDLITVCLSEDSPDVSDAERAESRRFLDLMRDQGGSVEGIGS